MLKHVVVVSCLLVAVAVQIFWFSPISPVPFEFFPSSSSLWPANNHLQSVIKVGEGYLNKPEDLCFDDEGLLYTATSDGWIKKKYTEMEQFKGVLTVYEDGVTLVTSHVNGSKLRFPDDVIATSDGTLYFSEASTKFDYHNWRLDYVEGKPYGQLLKYNPFLDETSIVLDNLYFANEDYVVVCETFRFRCLKHWIKGEKKGTTKIFVNKLPGGPDNINLAPDGSF